MTTKEEAYEAVRTLLTYLEGPGAVSREGLLDTPKRVIESWDEVFAGYKTNAEDLLQTTFNAEGYDGIVLLSNIEFHSTCEHHLQPFSGKAHVAYIPVDRIVGISQTCSNHRPPCTSFAKSGANYKRCCKRFGSTPQPTRSSRYHSSVPWLYALPWCKKAKRDYDHECYAWRFL